MTVFQSAILGLVQGLTEFIPVSSTGHLILTRELLGLPLAGSISFDAILQLATAVALIGYFWRDIWNIVTLKNKNLILPLIIGTIPAVILGLLLETYMDTYFRRPYIVAIALVAGSILFFLAERFFKDNTYPTTVTIKKGLMIGLFQCLALVPGFSRSGATISGGLFNGLSREDAARFSFLLSIPIILGTGLKKLLDIYQGGELATVERSLFISAIFAFVSGFLAIHFLLKFLKNHSLNYFGVYRILLAIIILIWL